MKIDNKDCRKNVFIIAEIGNNHEGNIKIAKKLIDKAVEAGADAVKFQTFITSEYISSNDKNRVDRLNKFQLSIGQFTELKNYCFKKKNCLSFNPI